MPDVLVPILAVAGLVVVAVLVYLVVGYLLSHEDTHA